MLVLIRFRPDATALPTFLDGARAVLDALARRPGWRSGRVGRAADDPSLWVLTSEWDSVGTARRALSHADVRVLAMPLLVSALDEPTAYEVLHAAGIGADGLGAPSALAEDR